MDPLQFHDYVISPTLEYFASDEEPWIASRAAKRLVLGTARAESGLRWLKQHNGPALGLYQIEPATLSWLWDDYLPNRQPEFYEKALALYSEAMPLTKEVIWNLALATALCRARYLAVEEPLPEPGDIKALAYYWKVYYNTQQGAGTVDHFAALMTMQNRENSE